MSRHVDELTLKKNGETYKFVYDGDSESERKELLKTLGRFATNQELSFTWYDAAVLSQKVRQRASSGTIPHNRFNNPNPPESEHE